MDKDSHIQYDAVRVWGTNNVMGRLMVSGVGMWGGRGTHAATRPPWCTQDALEVSLRRAGVAREEENDRGRRPERSLV